MAVLDSSLSYGCGDLNATTVLGEEVVHGLWVTSAGNVSHHPFIELDVIAVQLEQQPEYVQSVPLISCGSSHGSVTPSELSVSENEIHHLSGRTLSRGARKVLITQDFILSQRHDRLEHSNASPFRCSADRDRTDDWRLEACMVLFSILIGVAKTQVLDVFSFLV
ncbi:hypothetical protein HG531_011051 [Fusarium graminearum]|nr:hypothetical protein HG531_011051 [Fusarium graminearum]